MVNTASLKVSVDTRDQFYKTFLVSVNYPSILMQNLATFSPSQLVPGNLAQVLIYSNDNRTAKNVNLPITAKTFYCIGPDGRLCRDDFIVDTV